MSRQEELTGASGAAAGTTPSSAGAARFGAAIESFSATYASQLAGRGQSAQAAADSYTSTDDSGAANITAVSV